jgi:hypothetical protein
MNKRYVTLWWIYGSIYMKFHRRQDYSMTHKNQNICGLWAMGGGESDGRGIAQWGLG